MSTPLADAVAAAPAERDLFTTLIDDAAVFPPGNAPLDTAVVEHRRHREAPYAALVGPLLVPPARADDLIRLVRRDRSSSPLRVRIAARPGTPASEIAGAREVLSAEPGIELAGVEAGWTPDWRQHRPEGVPLALEVPRGPDQAAVIADIAAASDDSSDLVAKFRTGATPTWAWPDELELATFIRIAIDQDLGFKLTGGLHHAVRGRYAVGADGAAAGAEGGDEQHGLLNVLAAVRWALNGEEADELVPMLAERDPAVLVPMIERMSVADAAIVRAFFTAYGCCGVTDPITDLARLNLIDPIDL